MLREHKLEIFTVSAEEKERKIEAVGKNDRGRIGLPRGGAEIKGVWAFCFLFKFLLELFLVAED